MGGYTRVGSCLCMCPLLTNTLAYYRVLYLCTIRGLHDCAQVTLNRINVTVININDWRPLRPFIYNSFQGTIKVLVEPR
jgi:hypothetical protein